MSGWRIGILGGSGLYHIDALEGAAWQTVDTPWGTPSDQILTGQIAGVPVAFLPRHGRGHRIAPDGINARANIDALKRIGCTDVLAISAVGSLNEALAPGSFAVVDQFIDRTVSRAASFFGTGLVAHVSLADPTCPRLSMMAAAAICGADGNVTEGATYIAIEGPQFSTRAESRLYRSWGGDIIGMTAMPEVRLAREAELPYALIGMVTDYDAWRDDADGVTAGEIVEVMRRNASIARHAVERFVRALPAKRVASPIDTALDGAIFTAPEVRDPALVAKLDVLAGRALRH